MEDAPRGGDRYGRPAERPPAGPAGYGRGPERGPGGYDRGPGGYDRGPRPGGGYDRGPGGYDRGPGGYDRAPRGGGYDRGPGGYDRGPGGYDRGPGGYNRGPGGYDRGPGGYDRGPGNYDRGPGGYDRGPGGGYDRGRPAGDRGPGGGYNRGPGGYDRGPGGYDRQRPMGDRGPGPNRYDRPPGDRPMGPRPGGYDRPRGPGGPPMQGRGPGGPGGGGYNRGPARPPQGGPGRPGARPGPGGPRGQAPRPAPKAQPASGKVDKLHLEAQEFARNFSIPEAVAFQIVRGDFTLKEWMEKHAEAERKRKERDKVMAVKKQQRARDEGMAQQYFLKQKRNETPLFFRLHGGEEIEGPIRSILPYHFWIDVRQPDDGAEPKREKIEKLNVVMCYKTENDADVRAGLKRDDELAEQKLQPVREKEGRYELPFALVQKAAQDNLPLRALLNEGTIVEGTIDWYSSYFIKVKLSTGASVVVFNHGVHKLELVEAEAASRK